MMRSAIALWAKKATACLVLAIAVVMAAGVPVVAELSNERRSALRRASSHR